MKEKTKRPSEVINDFLSYVDQARSEYESSFESVGIEDKKVQTFLHDMEFASSAERNKVATKLHNSRVARREAKDKTQLYESIYLFATDASNQKFFKAVRRMLTEQRTQEKYLFGKREFKNRKD